MNEQNRREALTKANIEVMRKALEDPETDVADHAEDHVTDMIGNESEMSGWMNFKDPVGRDANAMVLTLQLRARASIGYQGEWAPGVENHPLGPEQQRIADAYATAAAYRLMGMANGDLVETLTEEELEEILTESGNTGDLREKLGELLRRACNIIEAIVETTEGAGTETAPEAQRVIRESLQRARRAHESTRQPLEKAAG